MIRRVRWIRWILPPVVLAACQPEASPFDGVPGEEPVLFVPGAVSTPLEDEYGVTFAQDGSEVFFTRGGGGRRSPPPRLFTSRFEDGRWTPAHVLSFSVPGDQTPFFDPKGSRIIYSSRRDVPGWGVVQSGNLWSAARTEAGWSEPVPLLGDVNRPRVDGRGAPARTEAGPVLLPDGSLLYWTTEDPDWGPDLYVADPQGDRFVNPRPLRLNSSGAEMSPVVSPDGEYLVFQAYRDVDAVGEDDLYVSARTSYGWGAPRLLPEPINSPASDGYPSFSPDGTRFFFASDRAPDGHWSIYYVATGALGLESADEATTPE